METGAIRPGSDPLRTFTIVNVAELTPVTDPFVDLATVDGDVLKWEQYSGLPANALERAIPRPRVSRYRAAWQAASAARRAGAIISHLPLMSAAVADAAWLRGARAPHLAFSFNFTALPVAAARARLRRTLARIDRFGTYTAFEADLYAEAFDIPRDRFRPLPWTQSAPRAGAVDDALLPDRPFVAAVGGEGRDVAMLIAAARALPDIPFVVIARPVALLADPPANMTVHFNVTHETCWGIASRAAALLVPLRDGETCCGHITLVSGQMLGLPIVTTASRGTQEYTVGFGGTTLVPAGELDGWVAAIRAIVADPDAARRRAAPDRDAAMALYDRRHWAEYVADFVRTVRV